MLPLQRHQRFFVSSKEIERRITVFQSSLKKRNLSLAWIDHLTDLYYFSGSIQNGILLIPSEGKPAFFVKKSLKRAEKESPLNVTPYPGRKGLLKKTKALLGKKGQLGLAFDVTPASTYIWLTDELEGHSTGNISTTLRLQKAIKSEWEITQIGKAAEQASTLFQEIRNHLRPGITELELSGSIESRLRSLGHGGTLRIRNPGSELPIINVVSGDSALYPTNFDGPSGGEGPYPSAASGAGWKRIAENETVLVDMVTLVNGYHADHARTFYLGRDIPEEAEQAHKFCLKALNRLEQSMHPGRNCADIYQETHTWAEKQGPPEGFMGYDENRVKFFGHGVGLELDELPIIAAKIDLDLKPGMVIAVEPKAFLKDIGPVGVENTYVITEKECQRFCPVDPNIVVLS